MKCKANGCPLTVDFITDWHEKEKGEKTPRPKWGVCWYHRAADGVYWQETTNRINKYLDEIQLIRSVKAIEHQALKPIPGENVYNWIHRSESYFNAVIVPNYDSADAAEQFDKLLKIISEDK